MDNQKKLLIEVMEADEKDGLYKQQTAVEWYYQQTVIEGKTNYAELEEQAKKMEKEQIVDSHIEGQRVFDKHPHTQWTNDQAEIYYNKTYGK
jgi:hypothetical protein